MSQFLVEVFLRATDLALVSIALSMVYSLVRFPNVALVQYATAGAFIAYSLASTGLNIIFAVAIAAAVVGCLSVLLNRLIFNRLLAANSSMAMVGSLAVAMLMTAAFMLTMGTRTSRFDLPFRQTIQMFDARITELQLMTSLGSVAIIVLLGCVLFFTDLGRCIRATAINDSLARATGINTARVKQTVLFISGVLAALGGISLAVRGEVTLQIGNDLLLPVFAAAILGGLGNPIGALIGSIVIAAAETVVTSTNFGFLFGEDYVFLPSNYAVALSFLLLVVTLVFMPGGLLSAEVKRG